MIQLSNYGLPQTNLHLARLPAHFPQVTKDDRRAEVSLHYALSSTVLDPFCEKMPAHLFTSPDLL